MNARSGYAIGFLICAALLGFALYLQYYEEQDPCPLCILQRVAFIVLAIVFLIGALYGAGIRHFDVASLPEIEDAATIPDAHLHFMHPVKSRHAIRRAYELGVRSFALDGEDELDKIIEATGGAPSQRSTPPKVRPE